MKKQIFLLAFLLLSITIGAQPAPANGQSSDDYIYSVTGLEEKPTFPGPADALQQYFDSHFKIDLSGRKLSRPFVLISFVVEKDGSISDARLLSSPDTAIGTEALRIFKEMTVVWSPGKQNGKVVRTAFTANMKLKKSPK